MDLLLNIDLKKLPVPLSYRDKILLTGSCFTEHIGNALKELKFSLLQNPHGILFDPASVCRSLQSYITPRSYSEKDLFELNEVWHSWDHHSRFSGMNIADAVKRINDSQQSAHVFLKSATCIVITLGSSYSYRLTSQANVGQVSAGMGPQDGVANCHRAPAQWFKKHLLEISETTAMLEDCLSQLIKFNPRLRFIFTVSPVRHIRDGVVENNRSKARLIESVHAIVSKFGQAFYFPAYELVIDVLRDYRFYDVDLVHPNYPATEFVLEKFAEACIETQTRDLMQDVKKIVIARKHKAFQTGTKAHQQFLMSHFEKAKDLQEKYPFLDLREEAVYFSQT